MARKGATTSKLIEADINRQANRLDRSKMTPCLIRADFAWSTTADAALHKPLPEYEFKALIYLL
jgi:hypothetical protein